MPRLVLRRAVGPHAVSVNRNSGEFGSVVAVAMPSLLRSRDHCRVRFAISHMMHAHKHTYHTYTCVCVSCSRLISIFRLPHSLVKGPQRLPASPFSLLLSLAHLFLVRIRSLTRALRRLIKIVMQREREGRGRRRKGWEKYHC